jgi:hypothetical protein
VPACHCHDGSTPSALSAIHDSLARRPPTLHRRVTKRSKRWSSSLAVMLVLVLASCHGKSGSGASSSCTDQSGSGAAFCTTTTLGGGGGDNTAEQERRKVEMELQRRLDEQHLRDRIEFK